ncbi:hypothetical protein RJI07_04755 [Mycoplasmatota bacterium WC30]
MPSIISKVTELDKEMRIKVRELEEEKSKLPVFLREQKKLITDKYNAEAKRRIEARRSEIAAGLKEAKSNAESNLKKKIKDIEKLYDKSHDEWVENIYQQCIEDYMEE